MSRYDNLRCLENIKYLLKNKHISIGKLEHDLKYSQGYFNRFCKNPKDLPVKFICEVAERANVSVDIILNTDLCSLKPKNEIILLFLSKVKQETINESIKWQRERVQQCRTGEGISAIWTRIFEGLNVYDNEDGPDVIDGIPSFESTTFGEYTEISGDCYVTEIRPSVNVFIMNVGRGKDSAIEVWIVDDKARKTFLACSKDNISDIKYVVNELAKEVEMIFDVETIDNNLRHILMDYIEMRREMPG